MAPWAKGGNEFSSVAQSISDSVTAWTAAHRTSLSIADSRSLFKLMCIESVMPSNHLILCRPLLLLPSIFPSIKVFSNESVLRIRWPKYWSFSISLSSEYSGLVSFRMDWLDLLAVQRTLKSLLFWTPQFKSINSSALSSSVWSNSHIHTWLLQKPCLWLNRTALVLLNYQHYFMFLFLLFFIFYWGIAN